MDLIVSLISSLLHLYECFSLWVDVQNIFIYIYIYLYIYFYLLIFPFPYRISLSTLHNDVQYNLCYIFSLIVDKINIITLLAQG